MKKFVKVIEKAFADVVEFTVIESHTEDFACSAAVFVASMKDSFNEAPLHSLYNQTRDIIFMTYDISSDDYEASLVDSDEDTEWDEEYGDVLVITHTYVFEVEE